MKTIIVFLVVFSLSLFAQEVKPPQKAIDSFNKKFANAEEVRWEKEGESFEVNFEMDDVEMSAVYDEDGELEETETEISISDLPSNAKEYVANEYKGYTITEAAVIMKEGTKYYEAEITLDKERRDLTFDSNGKLVDKGHDREANDTEDEEDAD